MENFADLVALLNLSTNIWGTYCESRALYTARWRCMDEIKDTSKREQPRSGITRAMSFSGSNLLPLRLKKSPRGCALWENTADILRSSMGYVCRSKLRIQ